MSRPRVDDPRDGDPSRDLDLWAFEEFLGKCDCSGPSELDTRFREGQLKRGLEWTSGASSPQFKAKVALELLSGAKPPAPRAVQWKSCTPGVLSLTGSLV